MLLQFPLKRTKKTPLLEKKLEAFLKHHEDSGKKFLEKLLPGLFANPASEDEIGLAKRQQAAAKAFADLRDSVFKIRSGTKQNLETLENYLTQCIHASKIFNLGGEADFFGEKKDEKASARTSSSSEPTQRTDFVWRDAFLPDSVSYTLAYRSILWEIVCITFNIAAAHSQIACDLISGTAARAPSGEALARAGKHYLVSAATIKGPLALYINAFRSHEGLSTTDLPRDLSPATLDALRSMMVACAQAVAYAAAELKGMSKGVLSQVAAGASSMLLGSLPADAEGLSRAGRFLPGLWIDRTRFHAARMRALAEWRFTEKFDADTGEGFGRHVARLKRAETCALRARAMLTQGTRRRFFDPRCRTEVETLCDRVQSDLREAVDKNNNVFMDVVPDGDELGPVPERVVAKERAAWTFSGAKRPENKLISIPSRAQRAEEERRLKAVGELGAKFEKSRRDAIEKLNARGLPASAEEAETSSSPSPTSESLDARVAAFVEAGGADGYLKRVDAHAQERRRARKDLDACARLLGEEKTVDDGLRARYGARWTRVASDRLAASYVDDASRYRRAIEDGVKADDSFRRRVGAERVRLDRLRSVDRDDDATRATKSNAPTKSSASKELVALRGALDRFGKIVKRCEDSLDKLRTGDGGDDDVAVVERLTGKDLIEALRAVETADDAWKRVKDDRGRARDRELADTLACLRVADELRHELEAGERFWRELLAVASELVRSVEDFKHSRGIEARELEQELRAGGGAGGDRGASTMRANDVRPPQVTATKRPARDVPRGFEAQIASLQMMGFTDVDRMVEALRASGGDTQKAVGKLMGE